MMAIAPVLVAIAFLVDPQASHISEDVAGTFVLIACFVWPIEALVGLARWIAD